MSQAWASAKQCRHCEEFLDSSRAMMMHFYEKHRAERVVPPSGEITVAYSPSVKQQGCQHQWVPEGDPDHCERCFMSFIYYTFMECL